MKTGSLIAGLDDEPHSCGALARFLKTTGLDVVTLAGGDEFLAPCDDGYPTAPAMAQPQDATEQTWNGY
jgi:hypothetical protein